MGGFGENFTGFIALNHRSRLLFLLHCGFTLASFGTGFLAWGLGLFCFHLFRHSILSPNVINEDPPWYAGIRKKNWGTCCTKIRIHATPGHESEIRVQINLGIVGQRLGTKHLSGGTLSHYF